MQAGPQSAMLGLLILWDKLSKQTGDQGVSSHLKWETASDFEKIDSRSQECHQVEKLYLEFLCTTRKKEYYPNTQDLSSTPFPLSFRLCAIPELKREMLIDIQWVHTGHLPWHLIPASPLNADLDSKLDYWRKSSSNHSSPRKRVYAEHNMPRTFKLGICPWQTSLQPEERQTSNVLQGK